MGFGGIFVLRGIVVVIRLCIMEMFRLQNFVTNPSIEQINLCRKQELLLIADHYKIIVSKQDLKRDIKNKLLQRLRELSVLPMSNTVEVESSGSVGAGDGAGQTAVPWMMRVSGAVELMVRRR